MTELFVLVPSSYIRTVRTSTVCRILFELVYIPIAFLAPPDSDSDDALSLVVDV